MIRFRIVRHVHCGEAQPRFRLERQDGTSEYATVLHGDGRVSCFATEREAEDLWRSIAKSIEATTMLMETENA